MEANTRTNLDVFRAAAIDRKLHLEEVVFGFFNPQLANHAPGDPLVIETPERTTFEAISDALRSRPWVSIAAAVAAGAAIQLINTRVPIKRGRKLWIYAAPLRQRLETAIRDGFAAAALPIGTALIGKGFEAFVASRDNSREDQAYH